MQLSGQVLDIYDDYRGELLRSIFPSQDLVPEAVKTAHYLSSEEHASLPDDVFALVLVDQDRVFRKFACVDSGNVVLSARYLEKVGEKLPVEARLVALQNLSKAAAWYGMEELQEELHQKTAGLIGMVGKAALNRAAANPLGTLMTAATLPSQIKGTSQAIRQNMGAVRSLEQAGAGVVTPENVHHVLGSMGKHAELSGTSPMPSQPTPRVDAAKPQKTVINKSAALRLEPYVNLGDCVSLPKQKEAQRHALDGRYPLDSYAQVKAASSYFDEHHRLFTPDDRREFCQNMVPRADELQIPVSDLARKYASDRFAEDGVIKQALDLRKEFVQTVEDGADVLDQLFEKRAELGPALFSAVLREFDSVNEISRVYGRYVPDHVLSTFGSVKVAEHKEDWSELLGDQLVTYADLNKLVQKAGSILVKRYGTDFVEEMSKDPIGIFKSLPRDQKVSLARLAATITG